MKIRNPIHALGGALVLLLVPAWLFSATPPGNKAKLWSMQPVVRPAVPTGTTQSPNPIDAFIAAKYKEKGLQPAPVADKSTLLRRVYLDLIGIPPSPAELDVFLSDASPDAYGKVVDKLLASEQYGVRYARHWLDVERYTDIDDRMFAASGIHYWRDWVISVLNEDIPYDQFVRAQLTGYRDGEYTRLDENGNRSRKEPRPYDLYAMGFLARAKVFRDGKDTQEFPITTVETVSTAFMGLTVGCAKCHDHMYDPISNHDFYAMKALFDPMTIRRVRLASQKELEDYNRAEGIYLAKKAAAEKAADDFLAPYKEELNADLRKALPPDVQAVFLKTEKQRNAAEQKIADDYHVIFKITGGNLKRVLPPKAYTQYTALQKVAGAIRPPAALPEFWTVEDDSASVKQDSYILTNGEPTQPQKDKVVQPGFPFQPVNVEFRYGRRETFADWLATPENPLFARVAVNRIWQWHFGEGLKKTPSDFGNLGGKPDFPELLDWLAAEFVAKDFSMKAMHKLMVTSDTYKMASTASPELVAKNTAADPANTYLWQFRLLRLEAEPLWDSVLMASGDLDLTVGGKSFQAPAEGQRGPSGGQNAGPVGSTNRRGIYMRRGYQESGEVMPNFLQVFDADDGRFPCPERTRTVTAPQSLFLMNDEVVDKAAGKMAARLLKESSNDLGAAVDLAYRITLTRAPSPAEKDSALSYIESKPERLKGFAWLLFNLDEFTYVR